MSQVPHQHQQAPHEQRCHHEFIWGNLKVQFPFNPHNAQRQIMGAVIEAALKIQNAMAQAQTGSGKTLAVISPLLECLRKENNQINQIIWMSRTHQQAKQFGRELKKSSYNGDPSIKLCLLGSRKYLCINSEIKDKDDRDVLWYVFLFFFCFCCLLFCFLLSFAICVFGNLSGKCKLGCTNKV